MSYLLDTCVLSEFARPAPDARVVAWLAAQAEDTLFTSAVVLGELAKGVAQLDDGPRKRQLRAWLQNDLRGRFGERVLAVTPEVALRWGGLAGEARRRGVQVGMADGLIGATGIVHGMVVVTRNVDDLEATGAAVLDPWEDD